MPSESCGEHFEVSPSAVEVLVLVAERRSDADIATMLGLTQGTVAQRIHRFCDRTGIRGRRLVVWANEHRICCLAVS